MEKALHEILDDTTPVKTDGNKSTLVEFFEHPLIDSLFPGEYAPSFVSNIPIIGRPWAALNGYRNHRRLPSYIPKENFTGAVLDVVASPPTRTNNPAASPAEAKAQRFKNVHEAAASLITSEGSGPAGPEDGAEADLLLPSKRSADLSVLSKCRFGRSIGLAKAVIWRMSDQIFEH
ncbi:MAG: hypothetical protein ACLPOA_10215 [Methylocella sp.]